MQAPFSAPPNNATKKVKRIMKQPLGSYLQTYGVFIGTPEKPPPPPASLDWCTVKTRKSAAQVVKIAAM